MIIIEDKSKCCGCGACVESCPQNCISFYTDSEGFWYPKIDKKKCINCTICVSVCPYRNQEIIKYNPVVVAAKAIDNQLRDNSSSGGVFSIFAEYVLSIGGIVCGVAMSEDCEIAQHIIVDKIDDLYKLRGSKYIPSKANTVYNLIRDYLENGRFILFSGVSCQIAGLKHFLRKKYNNLFTIEIICHGVPSPDLWKKYKSYWEEKHNKTISEVYFRSKIYGWDNFGSRIVVKNSKKSFFQFHFENEYFIMYNSGKALRPSCYNCVFKLGKSNSDVSIGDFWNIKEYIKNFDDNKGISLICINSEIGDNLFKIVSNKMKFVVDGLDLNKATKYNPGVSISLTESKERKDFYLDLYILNMDDFIKKYASVSKKCKIKGIIVKIIFLSKFLINLLKNLLI